MRFVKNFDTQLSSRGHAHTSPAQIFVDIGPKATRSRTTTRDSLDTLDACCERKARSAEAAAIRGAKVARSSVPSTMAWRVARSGKRGVRLYARCGLASDVWSHTRFKCCDTRIRHDRKGDTMFCIFSRSHRAHCVCVFLNAGSGDDALKYTDARGLPWPHGHLAAM